VKSFLYHQLVILTILSWVCNNGQIGKKMIMVLNEH